MPRNVEIKAKVKDIAKLKTLAEKLSGSKGTLIVQEDSFFNAPNGRLKLRQLQGAPAQLIFYSRSDQTGPKLSNYHISETNTPDQLKLSHSAPSAVQAYVIIINLSPIKGVSFTLSSNSVQETLKQALGIKGVVKKHRMLYMVGQTRIHVDQVEGLGDYMELEVVLKDDQAVDVGEEIADVLREKLEVEKDDLITGAYMDLILQKS